MDVDRFDALSRAFAGPAPRRGFLGLLLGLGGALGVSLPDESGAKRRRKQRRDCGPCRKPNRRGRCRKKRRDGAACGDDKYCENGRCRRCKSLNESCSADYQCCEGVCDAYDGRCRKRSERVACDPDASGQCGRKGLCCPQTNVPPFDHRCFHDPLNNDQACGATCDEIENCGNFVPEHVCVEGECVPLG